MNAASRRASKDGKAATMVAGMKSAGAQPPEKRSGIWQWIAAILVLCFVSCLQTSCAFNPDLQGKGDSWVQGEWLQDSVPVQQKLTTFSLYRLTFDCDSFRMQIRTFSRVNSGADSCMASGRWAEYVKGVYSEIKDTLQFRGQFCNADYSLKKEGECFRSGIYQEEFFVRKKAAARLELQSSTSVIPVSLRLIRPMICHPKPL